MKNIRLIKTAALSLFVYTIPGGLHAQCVERTTQLSTPFLAPDHWSREIARRLHGAGETPVGFDPASSTLTIAGMHDVLVYASEHAHRVAVDSTFRSRLEDEFGRSAFCVSSARLSVGVVADKETGFLSIGALGGPEGRSITSEVASDTRIQAWIPHVAISAEARAGKGSGLRSAIVQLEYRTIGLFAGRAAPGHRTTESGEIVLRDDVTFDGAGVYFTHPVYGPGFLRKIGPIRFESMLAPASEQVDNYDTWFWSARGGLQPFSFLGFNITRAAYITSRQPNTPPTLRDIARMLIGQNRPEGASAGYADNQVVAIDGWIRSPAPSVPLTFYWDWGADDSAGAWWKVAGRIFGLRADAVPGLPHVSMGIERTAVDGPNQSHGPWYKHSQMLAGWTENGVLLGHPIGGHGTQTLGFVSGDFLDARLLVRASGYRGARGASNIYAPLRLGRMHGATVSATLRADRHFDLRLQASDEQGDTWSQKLLRFGAAYTFF